MNSTQLNWSTHIDVSVLQAVQQTVQDELIKFTPKPGFVLSDQEEEYKDIVHDLKTILDYSTLVISYPSKFCKKALVFIQRDLIWDNFTDEVTGDFWTLGEMFYDKLNWVAEGSEVVDQSVLSSLIETMPAFLTEFEYYITNYDYEENT